MEIEKSMKYPPEHYPIAGIQHTRCVVALTMATLCMELYKGKPVEAFNVIKMSIQHCAKDTKKKKLSSGAKRDMDNCSIIISEYIESMQGKSGEELFRLWAALVWCALTFIEDAVYTCPYYTDGINSKRWGKLLRLMNDLAESLRKDMPGMDEAGTYLYEKAAWAMEGVPFRDDAREELLMY